MGLTEEAGKVGTAAVGAMASTPSPCAPDRQRGFLGSSATSSAKSRGAPATQQSQRS